MTYNFTICGASIEWHFGFVLYSLQLFSCLLLVFAFMAVVSCGSSGNGDIIINDDDSKDDDIADDDTSEGADDDTMEDSVHVGCVNSTECAEELGGLPDDWWCTYWRCEHRTAACATPSDCSTQLGGNPQDWECVKDEDGADPDRFVCYHR